jgi:hypothetical protein
MASRHTAAFDADAFFDKPDDTEHQNGYKKEAHAVECEGRHTGEALFDNRHVACLDQDGGEESDVVPRDDAFWGVHGTLS